MPNPLTSKAPVLLCTARVWEQFGEQIHAAAGPIDVVQFGADQPISDADLQRVTIAFFSGDAWPTDTAAFISTCLKLPKLQWLHTFSAGVDSPVFTRFLQRGVRLTTSSGSSARPIAQVVAWMMIGLSRNANAWARAQREHRWEPRNHDDLEGRNLAIIGMGPIGTEIALLGNALGMNVTGCRRTISGNEPCTMVTLARADSLIEWADYLVLALPLNDDTQGFLSEQRLATMKPTAFVINIGRGALIDESALTTALQTEQIAGAGLDVFTVEPLPAESPLWDLPNVIITPHNSSDTEGRQTRSAAIFFENLAMWRTGATLINEVFVGEVGITNPAR